MWLLHLAMNRAIPKFVVFTDNLAVIYHLWRQDLLAKTTAKIFLFCKCRGPTTVPLRGYPHGRDTPVAASLGAGGVVQGQGNERDGGGDGEGADEAHQEADEASETNHDLEDRRHHDGALQLLGNNRHGTLKAQAII